jgi:protein-L-isoaspartate(D-aspartate) O-methyltransferase
MKELINDLIKQGYLKTSAIIDAFYKINREDFVPPEVRSDAGANIPLPTFHGQTISQPLTVAFMLELLAPQKGDKILDVGSGSGWQSALLAEIVGESGQVYCVERIDDLKKFGENNVKKYNFSNTLFFCRDGSKGLAEFAPYDKIIVAATAAEIPTDLKAQLKIGGRLVLPVGDRHASQDIVLLEKVDEDEFKETKYPGFVFVPLIHD